MSTFGVNDLYGQGQLTLFLIDDPNIHIMSKYGDFSLNLQKNGQLKSQMTSKVKVNQSHFK